MTTLPRLALSLVCALGTARMLGHAQNCAAASAPLPPAVAAWLATLPTWSTSLSVDGSYGYKDNLLLSSADEERSTFARGSVELLLLHVPRGQFDYSLYVQADGTHFFNGRTVHNESSAWLANEFGYRLGDALKFSLPITGYYSDRVLDVSDTEVLRHVAELKEIGAMAGPTVRWTFLPAWWIEAQALGQRRVYEDHANDSNIGEGTIRVGWAPGERAEFRVGATERWRNYADRARYSAVGREVPGSELKISEREVEIRADLKWDEAARWRTTTRATVATYRDNGSGYFTFRTKRVSQELSWKGEQWSVRLGGTARRIDYDVQTVGVGIDPPARLKDEFSADLHIERKLSARWLVFAGYAWERTRSNDSIASYIVNEGLLGVRWSWEK